MLSFLRPTIGFQPAVCFLLLYAVLQGVAQDDTKPPAAVKAALIAKLLHFIDWKENPGATTTIGFLGDDPVAKEFNTLVAGKTPLTAKGRTVQMKTRSSASDLKGCPLVFISKSSKGDVKGVVSGFHAAGVVTVSDIEGFTSSGGMIGFVTIADRIKVRIDKAVVKTVVKNASVSIDPRLLALGQR